MRDARLTIFRARRGGFTLMELIVVMFIILVLIAVLIGGIVHAKVYARAQAARSALSSLGTALEAYYQDNNNTYPDSSSNNTYAGNVLTSGADRLAEGLMGYLDYPYDGAGPSNGTDGLYGFRVTPGGKGRVHGPYMEANALNLNGRSSNTANYAISMSNPLDQHFIDLNGNPILYYRSTMAGVISSTLPTTIFGSSGTYYFNSTDNSAIAGSGDPSASTVPTFYKNLGASNSSNTFTAGSSILGHDSYLLINAGDDLTYFTSDDLFSDH